MHELHKNTIFKVFLKQIPEIFYFFELNFNECNTTVLYMK